MVLLIHDGQTTDSSTYQCQPHATRCCMMPTVITFLSPTYQPAERRVTIITITAAYRTTQQPMDSLKAAMVVVSSPATSYSFHRSFTMAEGRRGRRGFVHLAGTHEVVDILDFVDGKLRRPYPQFETISPHRSESNSGLSSQHSVPWMTGIGRSFAVICVIQ